VTYKLKDYAVSNHRNNPMNRKLIAVVISVITLTFTLASLSAGNTAASTQDSKAFVGTWVILEAELGGQKLPDENTKGAKLILDEGKYRFQNDQGEYKLYPGEKIRPMDIMGRKGPKKGKTFLSICELEGDTLKICYDLARKTRPKEFKTEAGTRQFLVTYKRDKE
jgi:uncharacterized protein (TIGR03067 family)